jgi:hypothetical protein
MRFLQNTCEQYALGMAMTLADNKDYQKVEEEFNFLYRKYFESRTRPWGVKQWGVKKLLYFWALILFLKRRGIRYKPYDPEKGDNFPFPIL